MRKKGQRAKRRSPRQATRPKVALIHDASGGVALQYGRRGVDSIAGYLYDK